MRNRTLATAFREALTKEQAVAPAAASSPAAEVLLAALQRSVTHMDQIVLRRIGSQQEALLIPR